MVERAKRERALPEALSLMASSADGLYRIADELKKRPVLRGEIEEIAAELREGRTSLDCNPLEESDVLEDMERLAREEVAEVAKRHVCRLPARSRWRKTLIAVASIDHEFAVAKYDERLAKLGGVEAPAEEGF